MSHFTSLDYLRGVAIYFLFVWVSNPMYTCFHFGWLIFKFQSRFFITHKIGLIL